MTAQLGLFDAPPMVHMNSWTADLESAAGGSQTPNAEAVDWPGKAGRDTPPKGANRVQQVLKAEPETADATDREARSEVMALEGSESPTGRVLSEPALGAAPVFIPMARRTDPATSHAAGDDPPMTIPVFIQARLA